MITKIILVMFLTLFSLINFPNALAHQQLSTTILDQTNTMYCAESDSDENNSEEEEEPDCD